jgi:uncharacterized protein YbaP (TraB family)
VDLLNLLKRAAAALGAAAVAIGAAPAPTPAPPVARPALWEVSDPDTTIYLFGTIHLLPPHYQWESPKIGKAVAKADGLYVETIVDPNNPQELINALRTLGTAPGLPPLADRIDPAKRPLLAEALKRSGLPPIAFDQMKTWAAAFTLLGIQYRALGLGGEDGVEMTLRQQFATAGKPIGQLETNAEQLGFFNSLPEAAQKALLEGAIERPEAMGKEFQVMLNAWARGDVNEIARVFNQDLSSSPPLLDALLKRRNANWSRWIEQRLKTPGTVMLAVGAGHLAGGDSVQTLLSREGYKVRRLQ